MTTMNKRILVYALDGCNMCEKLLGVLNDSGAPYEKRICEEESTECDDLEDYINCSRYPIVVETDLISARKTYHCVNERVGRKTKKLSENHTLQIYFSLESLISILLSNN